MNSQRFQTMEHRQTRTKVMYRAVLAVRVSTRMASTMLMRTETMAKKV